MDAYISYELDRRYAEYKADPNNTRSKAVVDLILQAQIAPDSETKPEKLYPDFKAFAIRQIRLFVFAGHDSTSSTICYLFHLLSKNPKALKDIREEHGQVFGKDVDGASEILKTQPHLANDLSLHDWSNQGNVSTHPPPPHARATQVSYYSMTWAQNVPPTPTTLYASWTTLACTAPRNTGRDLNNFFRSTGLSRRAMSCTR